MSHENFSTTSPSDGLTLVGQHWQPETPKAVISLVHGLGEHCGRYAPIADWLGQHSIAMIGLDLRGHGRSEGKRGVARDFDLLLDDIEALTDYTRHAHPTLPHFLMGHSMGGNLVLNYGLTREVGDLAGIISQAPALAPAAKVPGLQKAVLGLIRPILPDFTANNGLDASAISRDEREVATYKEDPLVHDQIGAGLALDLLATGAWALDNATQWTKPLLLMHGGADTITSPAATARFAQKVGAQCTHREFSDAYHEIHNEQSRNDVYETIMNWLEQQLN